MGRVLKAASHRPGFNPLDSILNPSLSFIYTGDRDGWAGPFWNGRQPQGSLKLDLFFSQMKSVEISPCLQGEAKVKDLHPL